MELWAARGGTRCSIPGQSPPDRRHNRLRHTAKSERNRLAKQKAETMTPTPETIPTSQENPEQPPRQVFIRDILPSLIQKFIPGLARGLVYFSFELVEICLKVFFIFLFVNVCALSILFMGDYIFCHGAHAERFYVIANIIASHMTAQNVFSFIGLYWIYKRGGTESGVCATITAREMQSHTAN